MSDDSNRLTPDELFDTLSNDRRRACVRRLADADPNEGVPVKELAEAVARDLADGDPEEGFEQSTYISLVQTHLPKLDDYDVVDYDEGEKRVYPGPAFAETRYCLQQHESAGESADVVRWTPHVTAATALGLGGVLTFGDFATLLTVTLLLLQVGFLGALIYARAEE